MLTSADVTVPVIRGRAPPVIHTPLKLAQGLCFAYKPAFGFCCYVVPLDHCRKIPPFVKGGKALLPELNTYALLCKFTHWVVRILQKLSADRRLGMSNGHTLCMHGFCEERRYLL